MLWKFCAFHLFIIFLVRWQTRDFMPCWYCRYRKCFTVPCIPNCFHQTSNSALYVCRNPFDELKNNHFSMSKNAIVHDDHQNSLTFFRLLLLYCVQQLRIWDSNPWIQQSKCCALPLGQCAIFTRAEGNKISINPLPLLRIFLFGETVQVTRNFFLCRIRSARSHV